MCKTFCKFDYGLTDPITEIICPNFHLAFCLPSERISSVHRRVAEECVLGSGPFAKVSVGFCCFKMINARVYTTGGVAKIVSIPLCK